MSLHSLGEKMRTPPEKDLTKRHEVEKRTTKSHKPKRIRKINLTILGYQTKDSQFLPAFSTTPVGHPHQIHPYQCLSPQPAQNINWC